MLPAVKVIPALAVYNQDDVIVPVANVDADRLPHVESDGFNAAQNQGNDDDLKYQSTSVYRTLSGLYGQLSSLVFEYCVDLSVVGSTMNWFSCSQSHTAIAFDRLLREITDLENAVIQYCHNSISPWVL